MSERQWTDVIGVLRTNTVNAEELRRWAVDLGVEDLLERALAEADVPR